MINTKILISVVIVLLIGVAAASYQVTTKTPGIWQPGVPQAPSSSEVGSQGTSSSENAQPGTQVSSSPSSSSSGQSGIGGVNVNLSPSEAKKIALSHIDIVALPDASTGTPKLIVVDGKQVYNVPILIKNAQVGEIVVDANTGNVIEGAGGVGNGSNG
jgi:uncharacterized membrane protein YkoI